jgi:hypothetical protein
MKSIIFKNALSLIAIMFAVFGAFAFKQAPEKNVATNMKGWIRIAEGQCEETNVNCSDVVKLQFCSNGTEFLHKLDESGTDCPDPLYRIN